MTPYLIAHKVRGEPAFDIAERFSCPHCNPIGAPVGSGCPECDGTGVWWIVSTSGHRAYPFNHIELSLLGVTTADGLSVSFLLNNMPDPWPDHFPTRAAPTAPDASRLLAALGLGRKPVEPIRRRLAR